MADKRIIDFPETTSPSADYFTVMDSASDGVRKFKLLPASAAPLADGSASVGTSNKYAREDHVHPLPTVFQPLDADLTAIAALAATGIARRTGSGTWSVGSPVDLSSEVTGNLSISRLNSGTGASSSTFWRGDGAWGSAVTSVSAGTGMSFGAITGTGSVSADIATATNYKAGTANKLLDASVLSNTPGFSVHKNGTDQTGVVSATFTTITWSTEVYDVGNYFASNGWTPPAGKVSIKTAFFATGAISASAQAAILILKNGVAFKQTSWASLTNAATAFIAVEDTANGTDVYTVQAYVTTTSGSATIAGNSANTYFTGFWICP